MFRTAERISWPRRSGSVLYSAQPYRMVLVVFLRQRKDFMTQVQDGPPVPVMKYLCVQLFSPFFGTLISPKQSVKPDILEYGKPQVRGKVFVGYHCLPLRPCIRNTAFHVVAQFPKLCVGFPFVLSSSHHFPISEFCFFFLIS